MVDFVAVSTTITIIAGAILAILGVWQGIVNPYVWKPLVKLLTDVKHSFETLERIREQFARNGGSSLRDAIDRIEARQVISEQRSKVFIMDSSSAIFETDAEGDYTDVNRTYSRWLGRSPYEVLGKGWVNAISPGWRNVVYTEWMNAIKQEREFAFDYRAMDSEENSFAVHCNAFPLYNNQKKVVGWYGIVTKIDDKDVPEFPEIDVCNI